MLDTQYWVCSRCGSTRLDCSEGAIKAHRCIPDMTDKEIDAILDKVLNPSGNGKMKEAPTLSPGISKAKEKKAIAASKAEVIKTPLPKESEVKREAIPAVEGERVSLYITLADELIDEMELLVEYATEIGAIHKNNGGTTANFITWCIELGRKSLRQYAIRRREYIKGVLNERKT